MQTYRTVRRWLLGSAVIYLHTYKYIRHVVVWPFCTYTQFYAAELDCEIMFLLYNTASNTQFEFLPTNVYEDERAFANNAAE